MAAVAPQAEAALRRGRRAAGAAAAAGRPADPEPHPLTAAPGHDAPSTADDRATARTAPTPRGGTDRELGRHRARTGDLADGAADRLVGADADGEDQAVEAALRPKDLDEFVGQERVREQLDLVLKAARARGATADHVLLSGAPGLGKTTLSMIIAAEMGAPIRITSGPAIQHAGDLAAILSSLQEGEVLFLDEIHRMSRPAEEMLYMAMEDFRVDVIVGKGPGATAIPLELPPFTLVGATTRAGLLPPPLRDRFGFTAHMEFYDPAELERVIHRSARLLDVDTDAEGAAEIAGRSRGTPRIANRLLRRVRDYAQVKADGVITREIAVPRPCAVYEVDDRGLDRLDRAVLERPAQAVRRRPGGPVHARGRGGGGAGDGRGGRRAVPRTGGTAGPYPAGPGRDPRRLGSPRARAAAAARRAPGGAGNRACSGRDGAETRRVRNLRCHAGRCSIGADSLRLRRCRPYRSACPPP